MLLEIITPDRLVYEGEILSVTLQTAVGEITVLPGHIPLISILAPGAVTARTVEGEKIFAVSRGTVEVDGDSVRLLARSADPLEDLESEEAIEQAKRKAEQLMADKRGDAEGFAEATATLERELARLKVRRSYRRDRYARTLPSH